MKFKNLENIQCVFYTKIIDRIYQKLKKSKIFVKIIKYVSRIDFKI